MKAAAEEVLTAIAVMEDMMAAAATALTRTTCHHAVAITAVWSVHCHSVTAMAHSEAAALQDLQALLEAQVMAQHPLAVEVHSLAEGHVAPLVRTQEVVRTLVEAHMVAVLTATAASEAADKQILRVRVS